MLAPITHILPLTLIQRERLLPQPGRVVVRKGQKVSPNDVLAETSLAPEHILLDVARGLGLPVEKADPFIQPKAGDMVSEGDVIAGPVGLSRRLVRSPRAGKVVVAGGGQVLLEVEGHPYELRAGLLGIVAELIPDQGVIIETSGALIQGVWGNGRIDFGLLSLQTRSPEDVLTADRLDVSLRGAVILAGYCTDEDVLKAAGELPVRGMILASMPASLIPVAMKMQYPIIVLEGFGRIPMNALAFKLLSTNERREAALNAEAWNRKSGVRPEVVIPLPSSGNLAPPPETDEFKVGQIVRVVCDLHLGKTGSLAFIHPGMVMLGSGIRALAADITLESGETILIPLANLEVLE